MTIVDELIVLLGGTNTPFAIIEGAADLAAAMESGPKATPAAYVFVGREASEQNKRATGGILQRQERDVSVVYVVENVTDAMGAAGVDQLETIKAWARGAVVGFVPTSALSAHPIEHVEGAVGQFKDGRVWYEDVFSSPTYLKEQSS